MAAVLDGRNDDAFAMADAWNQGDIDKKVIAISIRISAAIYARPGSNVYVFCFLAATLNVLIAPLHIAVILAGHVISFTAASAYLHVAMVPII
eukprot:702613-Karenia_brevis.AAC.1